MNAERMKMRLVTFTVEKYRSITQAKKIIIGDKTILVGPNNEGKSNILRALVTAISILTRKRIVLKKSPQGGIQKRFSNGIFYDWEKDFPIHLQKKYPNGESIMILEFELTEEELKEFNSVIRSRIKGSLPLKLSINESTTTVSIHKKGPGSITLSKKSNKIADYISQKINIEHIPAVRTAQAAQRIVNRLVDYELEFAEEEEEYIKALKQIEASQKPILEKITQGLTQTLVKFLPNIKDVKIKISDELLRKALRRSHEIIIDDGTPTELKYKGDGVQSLAALGIMRHVSANTSMGKSVIIAIEEPESHLHPNAIHEIKEVIDELSSNHQIVLSTHCPIFVDRSNISCNIIVKNNKARPAKKIHEIREILGIRATDNLHNAELVLIVEGENDLIALKSLLRHFSKTIKTALENGVIIIDSLGGGSNLAYKAGIIKNTLCLLHVFLDHDGCGIQAFEKAKSEKLLDLSDVTFSVCDGMPEAEFEDMLDKKLYEKLLKVDYGVDIKSSSFKLKKKWSERIRKVFLSQGKIYNEKILKEIKNKVAYLVEKSPESSLLNYKRSSFDALVSALEGKINKLK